MSLKFETPITEVPLFHQGKVRDMYDLGDSFLMVASDRLSAFDVVLPTPMAKSSTSFRCSGSSTSA